MKNYEELPTYPNNNTNPEIKIPDNETNNLNIPPQNLSNINQMNLPNDKELEELDGTENLRFKGNINNYNPFLQQRLDSCDSAAAQYKFSIDLPNVPKQRLHEYLNDDLLNALDVSPNIPNLNSGLVNNKKLSISNENNDNNPNNLYGFSLYPQMVDNKNNNNLDNNQNNNNLSDYNKTNINNTNNMNYNLNNANNFNNYPNYNYLNRNNFSYNYNMNNPQIFIPTKYRNKEQMGDNSQQYNAYQNQKKDEQNKVINKFDNGNKKNSQNSKKDGKNKKHFEVRAGDWTCSKCNNLNFSFRNKCNRCGLPKELNNRYDPMKPEMFSQNTNYQLMNGINSNFIYGNNINNINNNINDAKFYPK